MQMYGNPINPLLGIMALAYGPPCCGYSGMQYGYDPNAASQYTPCQSTEQTQIAIAEMQLRNCIAEQTHALNMAMAQQCCIQQPATTLYIANKPVICSSAGTSKDDGMPMVYRLNKIIFPENPIRDYIGAEVEKIKKRYAERIAMLDALL